MRSLRAHNAAQARYRRTPKGKATDERYKATERGAMMQSFHDIKRRIQESEKWLKATD